MLLLDTLTERALYCSIRFYFCIGSLCYFSTYLHWFMSKTITRAFHYTNALFLGWGGGRGWGRLLFWGVLLVQNHWHYLTSCKCVPMSCKFTKRSVKGGKRIVSVVGGLSAANPTELEPGWGTGTLSTAGLWVRCAACPGSAGSSLVLAFSSASSWVRLSFCRLVSIALL